MKIRIGTLIAVLLLTQTGFAYGLPDYISIEVNEHSLSCVHDLEVLAPQVSHLVSGKYPDFKFRVSLDHACFYRGYFLDKAAQNNGELAAAVMVLQTKIKEPIYKCKPKPCSFCDPTCWVEGYTEYIEESVIIDILGLRFNAKSKLTTN